MKNIAKAAIGSFLALAMALLGGGCSGETDDGEGYAVGSFVVKIRLEGQTPLGLKVYHRSDGDRVVWQGPEDGRFLGAAVARTSVTEHRATYTLNETVLGTCQEQSVTRVGLEDGALVIGGQLSGEGCSFDYAMRFASAAENQLGFQVSLNTAEPATAQVILREGADPDERVLGFGAQYSYLDMKGRSLPVLVQEQGMGRGLQPFTSQANFVFPGSGGDWYTSYAAVPFYLTSKDRSLFLENSEPSLFDLAAAEVTEIKLYGSTMRGRILNGKTPLALLEEYTAYTGRMAPLPDWMNQGAVVGMQGGDVQVLQKLAQLQALGTPIGAFWLQDWVGQRTTPLGRQLWWNWQLNPTQYPGWQSMMATLRAQDIRVLTYVSPFLVDITGIPGFTRNLYQEAVAGGYLVRKPNGAVYPIENSNFSAGLVDLTNRSAWDWYKKVIKDELAGAGARGWMADFGEAFPFDAQVSSGESGWTLHNRYPELWSRLNREVLDELGWLEEGVFFSRAGFTQNPGLTRLFWLGDQMVTWDEFDGLKSAVKGLLSSGLSGFSLTHSDIGGYTTIFYGGLDIHRTKELFLRWTEANAFTAVYRTHEGSMPTSNTQFYSDEETYAHFARFAKVYAALAPYRKTLMAEAASTGAPIARHLLLHYPDDAEAWGIETEWLLGPDFLVAPVLDEKATRVQVYLPRGKWVHVWSGKTHGSSSQGTWQPIDAPLGSPPVFYKEGSAAGKSFVQSLKDQGVL